jgi:hypothetical protein
MEGAVPPPHSHKQYYNGYCHPAGKEKSIHSPSCYASILDLLHEDPKLSFLLTPQANYTETQTAPFWLEQLEHDNPTYMIYI